MTNPINNNNNEQLEPFSNKRKANAPPKSHQRKISRIDYFKLDELPDDFKIRLLQKLDIHELINIGYVNKGWNELSNHNSVWKKIPKEIDCPFEIRAEAKPIKQQVKDHIEDLRIKVSNIQKHSMAPKDLENILSKNLIIENGSLLNQFVNSWSKFIVFYTLANVIGDTDAIERINRAKTSDEIINLAKEFSIWFEKNKNELTQLQQLHLNNNQITTIPSEIAQLTGLQRLYLYNNQITTIPSEIGQLTGLLKLYLGSNQITTIPSEIGLLTQLQELGLYNNQITTIPSEIGQLTELKALHLNNNQITTIPSEIGQLTGLQGLHLGSNQITTIPSEIGQLTGLKALHLNNNQITTIPSEIGQLTGLKELHLDNNQITTIQKRINDWNQLKEHALSNDQTIVINREITRLSQLLNCAVKK